MTELFLAFFLDRDGRARFVGVALANAMAALLLVAAAAHLYTGAVGLIGSLGQVSQRRLMLADLVPNLPTWWVPESAPAVIVTVFLLAVGVAICRVDRELRRRLGLG